MPSRLHPFLVRSLAVLLLIGALPARAGAQDLAPGGLLELATSTVVRPRTVPPLPARGTFSFPAPYGTVGVRVTNATDCSGGTDCVNPVGYSYWRNTNNHVGSDTMLLVITLDRARGGPGPTLFSYDKPTGAITKVGPLFDAASSLSWATGEGWYWSATLPTALYVNQGPRLLRYDVLARTFETVFDATTELGAEVVIWQMHSSNDDRVHSATVKSSVTWQPLGCLVYREDTDAFSYFPRIGDFDECQVDRSGRWLVIKENVDGAHGEDNRVIDLTDDTETLFLDQEGAAGHSDAGLGYMIAEDNWHALPGAVRVWTFGQALSGPPPQGRLVYRTTDWNTNIRHISHTNARPGVPLEEQYACGGGASRLLLPRAHELVCFRLDDSLKVLVVAPLMVDLNAPGGGDDYRKLPKGNLDVTGEYFVWTSNAGGNRLDAFIARVPSHLLFGGSPGAPVPPPPVPPGPTSFTDDFARADSSNLGPDWDEGRGDLSIGTGTLRTAGAKGMHVAVVPALVGADQTVAGDFASVANNTCRPSLGVVLRYQDPANYYLAYRHAGSPSVLRLSRVVNGAEKILKSVSLPNPVANTFFRLGGRASGSTLTLQLNGVTKLTVSDSTFADGSPGVVLGAVVAGAGCSPRADNLDASLQ